MDSVGGYRVLRRLGGGTSSDVLLAHDDEQRAVVVRILDAGVDERTVAAVIEALTGIDHPSLLPLIDFAAFDDGTVMLVHPRLAGGTLGELLAERRRLPLEEASGLIHAVAGAVSALHTGGWVHGRIAPRSVLLSLSGEAVLAGFGDLAPIDAGRLLADLEGVRELALEILPPGAAVATRIADLPSDAHLGARVLDLVAAGPRRPVDLTRPVSSAATAFAEMMHPTEVHEVETAPRAGWLTDLLAPSGPVLDLVDRAWSALKQVRRPFWFGAAGVAVALIAASLLIPDRDAPAEASAGAAERSSEQIEAAAGDRPTSEGTFSVPGPAAEQTPAQESTQVPPGDAVAGDDPLAAAEALLAQRQRCLEAASEECLLAVTQDGSPARSDAMAALQSIAAGEAAPGPLPFDDEAPLVQRTGGSAIVTGGQASLLIIRTDDGWRLRDVFDSPSS